VLPSTKDRGSAHDSKIGRSFVPRSWIVALTVVMLGLGTVTLYSLFALWPQAATEGKAQEQQISWFGLHFTLSSEQVFFVVVALAGALGGLVHTVRSFSMYVGTRRLQWSWIPFNLLLPVVGALGGTIFYLVFRGGLFASSTQATAANPYGFAAVAALVGLFSEQAIEKLKQIAQEMFAEAPKFEPDHFDEKNPSPVAASIPTDPNAAQDDPGT
jgi:hypothetical protein